MAKTTKAKEVTRKPATPKTETIFIAVGRDEYDNIYTGSSTSSSHEAFEDLEYNIGQNPSLITIIEAIVPLPKKEQMKYKTIKVTVKE